MTLRRERAAASGFDVVRPIPGWTPIGNFTVVQYDAPGGFPLSTGPGPTNRGANFFAGGPDNASSSATQLIDLSMGAGTIDAGGVTFNLTGFLGGFDAQRDNAMLTATFLSDTSTTLGSASIGPVSSVDRSNVTGLLFRETSGALPVGTRSISLSLQMTRVDGNYNDGYADNLSLVLTPVPEPKSVVLLTVGLVAAGLWGLRRRRAVS